MRPKTYLLLLPLIFAANTFFSYPDSCIEIKDRQNLPPEVYRSLKNYDAILIGEVHGNNESPQFAEGMVNLWLASGEKVLLGLEINEDNQDNIDKFIQSGDFEIIKKMPFFNRTSEDGRSSAAMANLIRSFYKKENMKIVCLDIPSTPGYPGNRDSAMALKAMAAAKANPKWKLITYTGNGHNKTELGPYGYPMGFLLANGSDKRLNTENVTTIDVVYEGGSSWFCNGTKGCKEYAQGNLSHELAQKYIFDNSFIFAGNEKKFFTRKISASLPLNN
jgi:hypothetical protein